jgi:hypothetical protein
MLRAGRAGSGNVALGRARPVRRIRARGDRACTARLPGGRTRGSRCAKQTYGRVLDAGSTPAGWHPASPFELSHRRSSSRPQPVTWRNLSRTLTSDVWRLEQRGHRRARIAIPEKLLERTVFQAPPRPARGAPPLGAFEAPRVYGQACRPRPRRAASRRRAGYAAIVDHIDRSVRSLGRRAAGVYLHGVNRVLPDADPETKE